MTDEKRTALAQVSVELFEEAARHDEGSDLARVHENNAAKSLSELVLPTKLKDVTLIERALANDTQKIIMIRNEALEIVAEATPNDNPAASSAQGAIEEADHALSHYEMDAPDTDLIEIASRMRQAHTHIVKAEILLGKARAFLVDLIFPKKDD